jgi:hypothetical protein
MYNNNTSYNHYLVDWINYHRSVDEIVVVAGVVGIHLLSYLW